MTTPTPLARARVLALFALFSVSSFPPAIAAPQRPAARTAQTALEWVEVRYTHAGKTYTYYYPKNKPYTNDGGNERINLYSEPVLDDSKMARSHLWRKPGGGNDAPFSLHLITEKAVGAASDLIKNARNFTASAYRPPAPRTAPPAAPPAPAQPVASQPAPAQPAAPPADPAGGASVSRPDPPQEIRNGTVVGVDGGPPARLREAMTQGDRWQDVAKRIIPWAWAERAGNRSFVDPDARKRANAKVAFDAMFNKAVQEPSLWASAINVYYILGPGEPVPDWVLRDAETKKLLVDDQVAIKAKKLDEVLVQCLDRFQHAPKGVLPEACDTTIDRNQARSPYPGGPSEAGTWANPFLLDAGREALWLRRGVETGKGPMNDAVDRAGDTTTRTPDGGGQRNTTLPAGDTGAFGVDQLFGAWGAPNVFSLDGRTLALVVRTKRTFTSDDPPKPVLKNQLGLYDISNAGEIYGMRFDIDKTGEQVLALKSGGKQYKITMEVKGEDTTINIARAQGDAKPVFGGGQTSFPTVNEMFRMRAEKALNSAQSVVIGGETYRVTAESAGTGNLLFWSERELERQRDGISKPGAGLWARNLAPTHMAEVNKVQSGAIVPTGETVSLGFQAANGKWQGLRHNRETGVWVPAEGDAFKPKPTATAPSTPTTPPAGGQPAPGNPTTPGTPGGTAPTPAAAEATVAKLNSELGPETAKRVVFFVPSGLGFGRHLGIGRRGEDGKPIEGKMILAPFPGLDAGASELREAMHKGRYLILGSDKGLQVEDLLKFDVIDGKPYGTVGKLTKKDKTFSDVRDKEALGFILRGAGLTNHEAQITANLDKAVGNAPEWTVYGNEASHDQPTVNVLIGTSKCFRLYPKYDGNCNGDTSAPGRVAGVGQGMVLDPVGGATQVGDTGFLDSTDIGNHKVTRVEPKAPRAALYQAVDEEKKNWYLTFLIKPKEGPEYKRTFIAFRNAKSEALGVEVETPPSGLHIGGLTLKGALVETTMKASASDSGELSKAGFIGAYGGSNAACLGVVAWWGTELKDACDRCGAKMSGNACVEK